MTPFWENNKSEINEFIGIEKPQIQSETIMKTHHPTARLFLMALVLAVTAISCRKSPNTIGNNLIDGDNYIGVYHTNATPIICHSLLDSIGTKNVNYALLGSMKDPVFGNTQAGFYTQLHLSSTHHKFGTNPVLDSLTLQLYIGKYYGDTTTLQTVHVYEMTDTLSSSTPYYCYSEIPTDAIDHANGYQYRPHPNTATVIVGNDTLDHPVIRIPLSQNLGNYIMNLDSSVYFSPDAFKEKFPGLYVITESVSENGSVCYINLTNNTYSQLQLYYHEADNPSKTMRYDFYITTNDVFFNRYIHDYTQGYDSFIDQVLNGNTALGQQTVFMQAMGGVKAFVKFPEIEHWADTIENGHLVINEAKLVIPADESYADTSVFLAPNSFFLVGLNQDGTTFVLPDNFEGVTYWGGTYSGKTKSVTFRISEYLADVINGTKPNLGLYLGVNEAAYSSARFVAAGPESAQENKLHLEVTYSIAGE